MASRRNHLPWLRISAPRVLDNYEERLIAAFPADERGIRRFMRVMRGIGAPLDRGATPSSKRALGAFALRARQHGVWTLCRCRTVRILPAQPRGQLVLSMPNGQLT